MPDFLSQERLRWLSDNTPKFALLDAGQLELKDLDDDEVMACSLRDRQGALHPDGWRILPKKWHQRMQAEAGRRFNLTMGRYAHTALRVLFEIMCDPNQPAAVRRQCANDVLERVYGKAPDKVELTIMEKPYVEAMRNVAHLFGDSVSVPSEPTAAERATGEQVR